MKAAALNLHRGIASSVLPRKELTALCTLVRGIRAQNINSSLSFPPVFSKTLRRRFSENKKETDDRPHKNMFPIIGLPMGIRLPYTAALHNMPARFSRTASIESSMDKTLIPKIIQRFLLNMVFQTFFLYPGSPGFLRGAPAKLLHRNLTSPPSLWPGRELRKYHYCPARCHGHRRGQPGICFSEPLGTLFHVRHRELSKALRTGKYLEKSVQLSRCAVYQRTHSTTKNASVPYVRKAGKRAEISKFPRFRIASMTAA